MPREIPSEFAGHAGEFFVLAELTRRGWTASLTARNNRAFDILAKRQKQFVSIRVKTKTSITTSFGWNTKSNGEIFSEMTKETDFCVLVDIPDRGHPTYYILQTDVVDGWLREDFESWVTTPGARGQQRDRDNSRRIFYLDERTDKLGHGYSHRLAQYKNDWSPLG
jgi:hypothetical protein